MSILSNMDRDKGHWGTMVREESGGTFVLYRKGSVSLARAKLSVNPLTWLGIKSCKMFPNQIIWSTC